MKKMIAGLFSLVMILSSCNHSGHSTNPEQSSSKEKDTDEKKNKQVLNDIEMQTEGGVEVDKAFLTYEDGGLVPSSNTTSLGKPIYLTLHITDGWKEEMSEVSLGISEKISMDDGTVVLNEPDLFKNYTSFSAEDAKFLKLKAVINNMSGSINYFIVDYRVWDKKGKGVIKGSYRFYIK
jgi:hypothetical protein